MCGDMYMLWKVWKSVEIGSVSACLIYFYVEFGWL